jgi:hypothetical protein
VAARFEGPLLAAGAALGGRVIVLFGVVIGVALASL